MGITELLNMSPQLGDEPSWISLLIEAGIPEPESETYAKLFVENRISEWTVLSLIPKNLEKFGVTVLGNKLAILTHVKSVLSATWDSSVASTPPVALVAPASTFKPPVASVKLPRGKSNMIHPQYRKFIIDWNVYEFMTSSLVWQTSNHLFIAWDEIVQNSLVNSNRGFFKAIEQVVTKSANLAVHRMNFGSLMQHENEPIKDFLVLLCYMAVDCEFICPAYSHGLSNSKIKVQFLCAFQNEIQQTDLLAKASQLKTIEEIVQHAEAFETSARDQSQLQTLAKTQAARIST